MPSLVEAERKHVNSFSMVNFRWPPELVQWLKDEAKANNKSVNSFGQAIVQQFRLQNATKNGGANHGGVQQ